MSEQSRSLADDPFGGRHPTSHERLTGLPWDASYHNGPAPWDTGQPQPAIVRLASEGGFAGAVLDAGCGTGENALHVASLGLSVLGVDVAETALAVARATADDRGIEVEFVAADAFQLERLGRNFETVLDCGLFHTLDGDERPRYAASLASVTEHDGTLYVLCFRDDGPDTGPHPISQEELRADVRRSADDLQSLPLVELRLNGLHTKKAGLIERRLGVSRRIQLCSQFAHVERGRLAVLDPAARHE